MNEGHIALGDKSRCNLSSLRDMYLPRKDIMKLIDCILVVALLLCIEGGNGQVPKRVHGLYTKKFDELERSVQSTAAVKKIFRKVHGAHYYTLSTKCPQRLQHIISDKMNCSGVAKKLEPQLLSVELFSSMTADEQLWESIMIARNCSQLSGKSLKMCELALSGRTTGAKGYTEANLNEEINNCYFEERGKLSNYLPKR